METFTWDTLTNHDINPRVLLQFVARTELLDIRHIITGHIITGEEDSREAGNELEKSM